MKFLVSLVLVLLPLSAANPSRSQKPYFRNKHSVVRPHDTAGAPVVVNAASYLPGVSPGGLASIFGQDLSSVSDVVDAAVLPLPTELAGVSVAVNGVFAPVLTVAYNGSEDQINIQVPIDTPTGSGAARLELFNNGILLVTIFADSFIEDPGIFTYTSNEYAVALRASDFTLIGPDDPASPGEVLTLYTTGLGPVTVDVQDGFPAPSDALAYTQDPFQVLVDNEVCDVLFSGLAPGFVGLYQLNFVLPSDLPAGNLDLQITSQYANSNIAILPVM